MRSFSAAVVKVKRSEKLVGCSATGTCCYECQRIGYGHGRKTVITRLAPQPGINFPCEFVERVGKAFHLDRGAVVFTRCDWETTSYDEPGHCYSGCHNRCRGSLHDCPPQAPKSGIFRHTRRRRPSFLRHVKFIVQDHGAGPSDLLWPEHCVTFWRALILFSCAGGTSRKKIGSINRRSRLKYGVSHYNMRNALCEFEPFDRQGGLGYAYAGGRRMAR